MPKSFDNFASDPKNYSDAPDVSQPTPITAPANPLEFTHPPLNESWLDKIRVISVLV